MGVSRSAAQFQAKLKQAENVIGAQGDRRSLASTADVVKATMLRSAMGAGLRPGSKIAGKAWRGVYVRNAGSSDVAVGYAPPASLVNNPTKAHVVGARGLGTRAKIAKRLTGVSLIAVMTGGAVGASFGTFRGKGAHALHWGGSNFAAYVHVRGTRGKRFYERAVPVAQAEGGKEYGRGFDRALSRVFG